MINSINNKMVFKMIHQQEKARQQKEDLIAFLTIVIMAFLFAVIATWKG